MFVGFVDELPLIAAAPILASLSEINPGRVPAS
jgi:hypothetical protein